MEEIVFFMHNLLYMQLYFILITDVGPLIHAFTSGEDSTAILEHLQQFEAAVNNLRATGGGDTPEYALDAILAGLNYSFIDEYGERFTPMSTNSKMVVITDATSKNPDREQLVIDAARRQGVSIHFILSHVSYSIYRNIASQTGGIVYNGNHCTWSILRFHSQVPSRGKRKRSALRPTQVLFSVSLFATSLKVFTYTPNLRSGLVSITTPDGVETINVEDNVLIYLRSDPTAGNYTLNLGTEADQVSIQQDVSLHISLIYMDNNFIKSALSPLPACKQHVVDVETCHLFPGPNGSRLKFRRRPCVEGGHWHLHGQS